MPKLKLNLDKFLSDPAHKESRDFLFGAIDARINAAIEARRAEKKPKPDDAPDDENSAASGNIFDELFGGNDE